MAAPVQGCGARHAVDGRAPYAISTTRSLLLLLLLLLLLHTLHQRHIRVTSQLFPLYHRCATCPPWPRSSTTTTSFPSPSCTSAHPSLPRWLHTVIYRYILLPAVTASFVAKVLRERGCEGKTLAIYMERNAACCWVAVGALMVHTKFVDVAAWNKPNDLVRILGVVKPDIVITSKARRVAVTLALHTSASSPLHHRYIAFITSKASPLSTVIHRYPPLSTVADRYFPLLTVACRCLRCLLPHLQGAAAQPRDREIGGRDRISADP